MKASSPSSGQPTSPENPSSTVTSTTYFEYRSMFIGPLPLPEMLEHYERVLPGCAERILAMSERGLALTEEQMRHRQGIEAAVVQGDIKRADLGLKFGTIVMTFIIVVGAIALFKGHSGYGISLIAGSVSVVLGTYIHGTSTRRHQLQRRAEQVPQDAPNLPDDSE